MPQQKIKKSTKPIPRQRKLSHKNQKKVAKQATKVAGSFRLLGKAIRHLWLHKRTFGAILLTYSILYFVFVKGLATNFQLTEVRDLIKEVIGDELGTVGTAATLFGVLIGTTGSVDTEAAGVYQILLLFIVSLAIIWALRYTYESKKNATAKQSFYQAMTPAIPFLMVCIVILLQLIPAFLGLTMYGIAKSGGLIVSPIEELLWILLLVLSMGISIFWTSSSVLAAYIVTLPNMKPMQALRSARRLVKFRRFLIIRKFVFLPLALFIIAAIVLFPLVLYAPMAAEILFLFYTLLVILIGHSYLYELYRELL